MRMFENPANGHRESVAWSDGLAAALFGIFYLAFKGLWSITFIWLAAAFILIGGMGGSGFIILFPIQLGLACAVPSSLANRYLQRGWREVRGDEPTARHIPPVSDPDPVERFLSRQQAPEQNHDTKPCPFCAEDIKAAAIRCKHCQADLTATT